MARRILVVDDVATNRLTLRVSLAALGYDVLQAETSNDARELIRLEDPDLMILSDRVGRDNGLEFCASVKSSFSTETLPIIVMTRTGSGPDRLSALRAGADELLAKPVDDLTLAARVRALLRARETHAELVRRQSTAHSLGFSEPPTSFEKAGSITLVSSNPTQLEIWRTDIGRNRRDTLAAATPERAIAEAADGNAADVYVLGDRITRPGGILGLVSDLRAIRATRYAAILTAHTAGDRVNAAAALDAGANDILPIPHTPEELSLRIRSQMRRKLDADRLRDAIDSDVREALYDPLTGLFNRRYVQRYLQRSWAEARCNKYPVTILMIDIDHFKGINDAHGHASGDRVLAHVSQVLADNLRGESVLARWGGEEFIAVLPGASSNEAQIAARRLCEAIESEPFLRGRVGLGISVTASIGGAILKSVADGGPSPDHLVERADDALYRAKAAGRNRFELDLRYA